mmetsp:Transcript_5358/g.10633  ORF Transcript_5358/g.10633 Transcript_5358/m.10633 type:complete len:80 (-) Transcript_5358:134-373(-)|eukprot:scaffold17366_cov182-Amphora_coffeaeformis.AAC.12
MSANKLQGSFSRSTDDSHSSFEEDKSLNACPWLARELDAGRPDDWVGGYSPAWIHNYRHQQERKKTIEIAGYNKVSKKA